MRSSQALGAFMCCNLWKSMENHPAPCPFGLGISYEHLPSKSMIFQLTLNSPISRWFSNLLTLNSPIKVDDFPSIFTLKAPFQCVFPVIFSGNPWIFQLTAGATDLGGGGAQSRGDALGPKRCQGGTKKDFSFGEMCDIYIYDYIYMIIYMIIYV